MQAGEHPTKAESTEGTLDLSTAAASTGEETVKDEAAVEAAVEEPTTNSLSKIPDGGLEAWLVVFGGWLILFSSFGYVNAFGVYQSYYSGKLGVSDSAISWIGSVQLWMMLSMGLFIGKPFDDGHGRLLIFTGSVLFVIALFMTSLCTKYYQVFLAQAVLAGMGLGTMFNPAISVVPQWFSRRRALAMGIVVSGSSLGGVCFPIMLNQLFVSIGYAWAVRASAFLCLGCLIIANLLVKPRLPARKKRPAHMQFPPADIRAILHHKAYLITIAGGFFIAWGLFFPFFYIQFFAEVHGISPSLSFYTLSILNAASVFGRILPNFLADKLGSFNMIIIATYGTAILIFAWLACTNEAGVVIFSLLYGFFSGSYVSIIPTVFASLSSHIGEMGVRMGLGWAVIAIAALTGSPIAGALLGTTKLTWWKPTIFAGISVLVGSSLLFTARMMQAKKLGRQKV